MHRSIKLCPLTKALMSTPQMQRLKNLKQLGVSDNLYMCATHTRFQHSLGVMTLAEQLLRGIKERQPKLDIIEKDIVCVKIAVSLSVILDLVPIFIQNLMLFCWWMNDRGCFMILATDRIRIRTMEFFANNSKRQRRLESGLAKSLTRVCIKIYPRLWKDGRMRMLLSWWLMAC